MPDLTNLEPVKNDPIKKIFRTVDLTLPGEEFSALAHIRSLCGKRVILFERGNFYYGQGWRAIIEDFMNAIRTFHVTLDTIHEDYGQLEIRFTCHQKSNEVEVWRARLKAINLSKGTCIRCGAHGSRLIMGREVTTLCSSNDCMLSHSEPGIRTGTWLDDF